MSKLSIEQLASLAKQRYLERLVGTCIELGATNEAIDALLIYKAGVAPEMAPLVRMGAAGKRVLRRLGRGELKQLGGLPQLCADLNVPVPGKGLAMDGEPPDVLGLNERYFVTSLGSKAIIADEGDGTGPLRYRAMQDMKMLFANQFVIQGDRRRPLFDIWLEHPERRAHERIVFAPPPLVCPPDAYNLWKGFAVEPDAEPNPLARCQKMLLHLKDVICDGHLRNYWTLIGILARTVQAPGEPTGVVVSIVGPPGVGKGLFVDRMFGALFGRHYVQVDKQKHITGAFNAHLSGKVVVFADEAVWAGSKQDVGALKRLITERTQTIERKGFDAVEEQNCVHLFMATNEPWSYPAGDKERRLFALTTRHDQQSPEYFEELLAEIEGGGRSAFLAYLQQYAVPQDWRRLPATTGLADQQDMSLDAVQAWWQGVLLEGSVVPGQPWPAAISTRAMREQFREASPYQDKFMQMFQFTRLVKKYLPAPAEDIKFYETQPHGVRLQVRGVKLPPLATCRKYYESRTGRTFAWGDSNTPNMFQEVNPIPGDAMEDL